MSLRETLASRSRRGSKVLVLLCLLGAAYFSCQVFRPASRPPGDGQKPAGTVAEAPQAAPQIGSVSQEAAPAPAKVSPTPLPSAEEVERIDISSWKIYESGRYGFELRYPGDWTVVSRGDYQVHFLAPSTPRFAGDEPGEGEIWISMEEMQGEAEAYLPAQYALSSDISLGGKKATLYTGVPGGPDPTAPAGAYTMTYLVWEKEMLRLSYLDDIADQEDDGYIAQYFKMLSTFRFIR